MPSWSYFSRNFGALENSTRGSAMQGLKSTHVGSLSRANLLSLKWSAVCRRKCEHLPASCDQRILSDSFALMRTNDEALLGLRFVRSFRRSAGEMKITNYHWWAPSASSISMLHSILTSSKARSAKICQNATHTRPVTAMCKLCARYVKSGLSPWTG